MTLRPSTYLESSLRIRLTNQPAHRKKVKKAVQISSQTLSSYGFAKRQPPTSHQLPSATIVPEPKPTDPPSRWPCLPTGTELANLRWSNLFTYTPFCEIVIRIPLAIFHARYRCSIVSTLGWIVRIRDGWNLLKGVHVRERLTGRRSSQVLSAA